MRIMYFGDGEWAQLAFKKIIEYGVFEIIGVALRYDKQDPILFNIARENDIPVYAFEKVNENEVIEFIRDKNIDLGVSMSFNQIIGSKLRETTRLGFINCHAGKLPYYRGRNILNWAIINDEKEIGITAHFIDNGIDTGDIISQAIIPIDDRDDYLTLLNKAIKKCPEVLLDALIKIRENRYSVIKQDYLNGSYFSYRRLGDEYIDWNWSSRRIFNLSRAITKPGPGAYTYYNDKKVYIWKASLIDASEYISTPGEVINKTPKGNIIKTGDTSILIEKISFEDDLEIVIPKFKIGSRLGVNIPIKLMEFQKRIDELEERLNQYEKNIHNS